MNTIQKQQTTDESAARDGSSSSSAYGQGGNIGMIEVKFISKVTTMGEDRLFIQIPKESLKAAKDLKGKYVRVLLQEITLEDF